MSLGTFAPNLFDPTSGQQVMWDTVLQAPVNAATNAPYALGAVFTDSGGANRYAVLRPGGQVIPAPGSPTQVAPPGGSLGGLSATVPIGNLRIPVWALALGMLALLMRR